MYYLRARYYDPQTGRFTSFDTQEGTVDASQDLNRYVYCRNNPVKYVDPSGEIAIVDDAVILAMAVTIAIVGSVAIYFANGKSNPHDLERGMSKRQKGMFQCEIEDWKYSRGMRPNDNVPWQVLVALAKYIKDNFK